MTKWVVFRTKNGIMVREVYAGVYIEMKKDPNVLEWWTIEADMPDEAKQKHKGMVYPYGD